jgi:hypothetical protein
MPKVRVMYVRPRPAEEEAHLERLRRRAFLGLPLFPKRTYDDVLLN